MATTTDKNDYGLVIFNEQGVDVLGGYFLSPKLIGSIKLRQKSLGELFVVADDGTELPSSDNSRNISLDELRGRWATMQDLRVSYTKPREPKEIEEWRTEVSHRYRFSPYGDADAEAKALLPAVIHGWGREYHRLKHEMAELLVQSVISGMDLKFVQCLKAGADYCQQQDYREVFEAAQMASNLGTVTGLPFTLTFRSTALADAINNGFGMVATDGGSLIVEMTEQTEITICFYETAGIPFDYFAKCSTVTRPPAYGVAAYSYEPREVKYVMPSGEVDEFAGKATHNTLLEIGSLPRARYIFADYNEPRGLMEGLDNPNIGNQRRLTEFLEGDATAQLRYEYYSNSSHRLRLLHNDGPKGGQLVTQEDSFGEGNLFSIQAGHDYSKVHTPLQHASPVWGLSGGGLLGSVGNASANSFFERSTSIYPKSPELPFHLHDYNGAPWNPTRGVRQAEMMRNLFGFTQYTPTPPNPIGNLPGFLSWVNDVRQWAYDKTWRAQLMLNTLFKGNPIVGHVNNPNYSALAAAKRNAIIKDIKAQKQQQLHEMEMRGGAAELVENAFSELRRRAELWDMVTNALDMRERRISDRFPFYGCLAYRHSNNKLEVWGHRLPSTHNAVPEYVPENWIMCQAPY